MVGSALLRPRCARPQQCHRSFSRMTWRRVSTGSSCPQLIDSGIDCWKVSTIIIIIIIFFFIIITSWLRHKMPNIVQSGTGDRGGQRLLTSWMRPKSSSDPTVSVAPVSAMEYTSPAPEDCAATVPVVENISPAQVAQVCPIRSTGPVWRTSELRTRDQNTWTVTGVDTILLAFGKVVRTLPFL